MVTKETWANKVFFNSMPANEMPPTFCLAVQYNFEWANKFKKNYYLNCHESKEGNRDIAVLIKLGWVFSATLRPLYPWQWPGTPCVEDWVGLTIGVDRCEKSRPPPVFDPRTVQPIASGYTDDAIPALKCGQIQFFNHKLLLSISHSVVILPEVRICRTNSLYLFSDRKNKLQIFEKKNPRKYLRLKTCSEGRI